MKNILYFVSRNVDFVNGKVFIKHNEIRIKSFFNLALVQLVELCGGGGKHSRCLGESEAAFVDEHTEKYVGGCDASRKCTSVGKLGDSVLNYVCDAAHYALLGVRARNTKAVGDGGNAVDALDLDYHSDEIGRQMLAVGNDLGAELVAQIGAFDNSE